MQGMNCGLQRSNCPVYRCCNVGDAGAVAEGPIMMRCHHCMQKLCRAGAGHWPRAADDQRMQSPQEDPTSILQQLVVKSMVR
jgi:hypothetical protein